MGKSREYKKKFHAFEFNDISFLPTFIRESTPEVLGKTIIDSKIYEPVGRMLARFCEETGCDKIFDLCSGTGKPIESLIGSLISNEAHVPEFILSDLFPNIAELQSTERVFPEYISVITDPVNALKIPSNLPYDALSMVASFHHFSKDEARRILSGAVKSNKPIFILEPITGLFKDSRTLGKHYVLNSLKNPFTARKNNILKIVFTYIIPILPIIHTWDAIISMTRVYGKNEFYDLTSDLTGFAWGYLKIPVSQYDNVGFYFGIPKQLSVMGKNCNQRRKTQPRVSQ